MNSVPDRTIAAALSLSEPGESSHIARLRRSDEFIACRLSMLKPEDLRRSAALASWHLIRYIDPGHLKGSDGIVVLLRLIGTSESLPIARGAVELWLSGADVASEVRGVVWHDEVSWSATNAVEYGGDRTAPAFATFLHGASLLTLLTLSDPSLRASRDAILQNWRHCLNMTTVAYDWQINGPPSIDQAAA